MCSTRIVLAFDVYGTLLSTDSIAKRLASYCGEDKAKIIATTWRKYQLEYTWRLNSMGLYIGFDVATRRSMRHACLESGLQLTDAQEEDMMQAYDALSAFPDVHPALKRLQSLPQERVKAFAFSNGTYEMIASSMRNAADLAPHTETLLEICSVDEVRKFKPAPEPYYRLAQKVGKRADHAKEMSEMWLVSSNPFDVAGARAVGWSAIWVDRAGTGWQDSLMPRARDQPNEVVRSLEEVVNVVEKLTG